MIIQDITSFTNPTTFLNAKMMTNILSLQLDLMSTSCWMQQPKLKKILQTLMQQLISPWLCIIRVPRMVSSTKMRALPSQAKILLGFTETKHKKLLICLILASRLSSLLRKFKSLKPPL